jgi:hypothetical protein
VTCSTPATGNVGQSDYIGGTDTTITRWGQVKSIKGKLDDQGMQQMEGRRFFQIKMRYDRSSGSRMYAKSSMNS